MFRFVLLLVLFSAAKEAAAANCKGCTPLDSVSFDKLVNAFRVALVKFDVAYPYGDKHDEFAKVAADAAEIPEMLVGEVGIKDYGDKENDDLAKRFNVAKDDFPVAVLFVYGKDGKRQEHKFDGDFKSEALKSFVRQKSGIYMPLPGCIEELDVLAERFVRAAAEEDRAKLLKEAEEVAAKHDNERNRNRAALYIKVMKKIAEEGVGFVAKEVERTKKMSEGKVADKKRQELKEKLNLLQSFNSSSPDSTKDKTEL